MKQKPLLALLALSTSLHLLAAELVTNGGMTNNASGWLKYPDTTTKITTKTDPALPGPVQLLVLDTRENGMNSITTNAYQKIPLKSNTKYRISFVARSESGTPADLFVRVVRSEPDSATTKNIFFDNYKNPTIVTRRVRVSDGKLTPFSIDFETGDLVAQQEGRAVEYAIAFSSRSYGTYSSALGGLVGLSLVSLQDQPNTWGSISNLRPNNITTIDINQAGYLGANKPFIFTISNLPLDVSVIRSQLKRMSAYGKVDVVSGLDGKPILASVVTDKQDLESNQRVITLGINTDPAIFPDNLIDDLQSSNSNNPAFGNRQQGYFIEVEFMGYDKHCVSGKYSYCWEQPWGAYLNSALFPISKNIYAKMSSDALKYFTANTAGKSVHGYSMAIDDPAKQEQGRTAGHTESDKTAVCRSGEDRFGNDFSNGEGQGCTFANGSASLNVSGGWYDAGDQGKYVVNGGVSLWTIQNLIERLQRKADLMVTGSTQQAILVSRVNSLMRIAKDEMDFMLRMQAPEGTKAMVPVGYQGKKLSAAGGDFGYYQTVANTVAGTRPTNVGDADYGYIAFNGGRLPRLAIKLRVTNEDVSGMVFHSVTDENWTPLPTAPANDIEKRILSYPTSAATLNMAAVAAQAYRIWTWDKFSSSSVVDIDGANVSPATYAQRCLTAAEKAYNAAKTRYESKKSIYRYEYSNDDWSGVDPGTRNLGGVKWVDDKFKTNVGPNFELLSVGFALPPQWLGGGAYGDYRIIDEMYWASMELFLAKTKFTTADDKVALVANAYKTYLTGNTNNTSSTPKYSLIGGWSFNGNDIETGTYSKFEQSGFPVLGYSWIKGFEWQNLAALGSISALTVDKKRFAAGENFTSAGSIVFAKAGLVNTTTGIAADITIPNGPLKNLKAFADTLKTYVNDQAYRFAKNPIKTNAYATGSGDARLDQLHNRDWQYEWGSNGNVVNRAMLLALTYDLTNDKSYADAAVLSMDYVLGRNANGYSFVTGYGMNPIKNPHHRFWAKIVDPNYPAPIDGVLLGGPNSRDITAILANATHTSAYGSVATVSAEKSKDDLFYLTKAVGKCRTVDNTGVELTYAPQKCFIDHPSSFATSEVAINWNAPLAWMTQFLYEYGQQP